MRFYERMICQIYISKPYLVDGFKFDMRVYTLVTSVDPLRIFVYNDGLARFATSRYKEPAGHNTTNSYMHLTNYSVNKHSRTYVVDDKAGSKRRLSTLNEYFKKLNEDVVKLWESIDDIIVKTIIAAHPVLKHSYNSCFATHDILYACFELLGFDILLDNKLKPYLLEVNHSPSFHTDAKLDKDIKENLLIDTFAILNLPKCYRKRAMFEDKQRAKERLLQNLNPHNKSSDSINKSSGNNNCLEDGVTRKFCSKVEEWEMNHLGNFRLVYPNDNCDKYKKYFEQNMCSIFQETFASRAREEARRIHKEEFETKVLEEQSRRIVKKEKEKRSQSLEPESPCVVLKRNLPTLKKKFERLLCSFEPSSIDDREETERSASMTQRDYLVRSYGIIDHAYQLLEQGGNIKLADLTKYRSNEKNKSISSSDSSLLYVNNNQEIKSLINILPKVQDANARKIIESSNSSTFPIKCTLLEPSFGKCLSRRNTSSNNEIISSISRSNKMSNLKLLDQNMSKELTEEHEKHTNRTFLPGLRVTCNEAAMWTRPSLPDSAEWPSNLHAKSTRTFIARHFSNTMKLQDLESRLNGDRELKLNAQRQSTL